MGTNTSWVTSPWHEYHGPSADQQFADCQAMTDPAKLVMKVTMAITGGKGLFTVFHPSGSIEQFEVLTLKHRWAKLVKKEKPK